MQMPSLAAEITRADKTVSGYQKAVQIYLPAIIAICALALLVVKTPNWQASMVAIIAMMAVIMLVDTNASKRMEDYQKTLEEFHTSNNHILHIKQLLALIKWQHISSLTARIRSCKNV